MNPIDCVLEMMEYLVGRGYKVAPTVGISKLL